MSVMSILQPSPTAVQVRPREVASDLDAVRSSGWLDSAAASYEVAKDEVPAVQDSRLMEGYNPVVRTVAKAMGKSPVFGYFSVTNAALGLLPFTSNDTTDKEALWDDIATLQRQGKLPAGVPTDRAKFESEILTRGGQRTVDQMKAAQGSFTARVVGGIGASFHDPVQVGVALATGGASRGLTVGRSILVEGLLNAGAAAVEMPLTVQARAALGETTTASDVAAELGTAFAFGAAADLGMRGVSAGWSAGKSALAIPERTNPVKVAKAFAKAVPEAMRTPEQQAALHVIEREASLAESAPKGASAPEVNAHLARLDAAQRALVEEGRQAGARGFARAVDVQDGKAAQAAFKTRTRAAESGGNDLAAAATSSAYGRYQFTRGTWESYYVRRYGRKGLSDEQIAAKRADPALQEQLMDDLTADNAAHLRRIGAPVTEANLYLAHLLGPRDAEKVLHAAPDTPLAGLISAKSIAANKSFMAGRKVADIIAFSERKMRARPGTGGGSAIGSDAMAEPFEGTMADVMPPERAAALTAQRPDVPSAEPVTLAPQIEALVPQLRTLVADKAIKLNNIDALAQQFDVTPDDIRAGFGELVRKGELAQRRDNGAFTRSRPPARDESLIAWIKRNGGIWDGDGTNFKGGDFAAMKLDDWYKLGPFRDKGPIIRSDDFARQNRGADKIMRAAVEEGYFPELRAALDGNGPDSIDTNLLLQAIDEELRGRPRYPIGTSGFEKQMRLRPNKDWKPEPDEVPNTSPRTFEQAEAQFPEWQLEQLYFQATWIGRDLASFDPWILDRAKYLFHNDPQFGIDELGKAFEHAINDYAAKTAAEALAATGERQYGDISYEWPTHHDPVPGGEGSAAEADSAGYAPASGAEGAGQPRGADPAGDSRQAIDGPLPDAVAQRFSDPVGPEAKAQAASFTHDLEAALDPNIAARTRQEADIAAQQPLDGARKTGVAQDPTMPEGLFGGPVEPPLAIFNDVMFDTGGPVPETPRQALARLDDDDAALAAMRGCL